MSYQCPCPTTKMQRTLYLSSNTRAVLTAPSYCTCAYRMRISGGPIFLGYFAVGSFQKRKKTPLRPRREFISLLRHRHLLNPSPLDICSIRKGKNGMMMTLLNRQPSLSSLRGPSLSPLPLKEHHFSKSVLEIGERKKTIPYIYFTQIPLKGALSKGTENKPAN